MSKFEAASNLDHMPQALLLVAPQELQLDTILQTQAAKLLCLNVDQKPCGSCGNCSKISQNIHPDMHVIRPDTAGGPIKIDQIRELQHHASQTPQLAAYQLWILQPADALNQAAAASLLKILEEPPASSCFILVTASPNLLLPTILSRCQRVDLQHDTSSDDLLTLGKYYPESSTRATLCSQRLSLLSDLDALLAKQQTPCDVAQRWSEYPLSDLLWFLYALIAKMIDLRLVGNDLEVEYQDCAVLTKVWRPEGLFAQLDTLHALMRKSQNNINLNANLALERILLGMMNMDTLC
ncbi:MAG: hypothetical protein NXI01_00365 [Gammaproteobacteria bacterium]|nr:hypothetical protein [Gammaproteobacteria bacterium]